MFDIKICGVAARLPHIETMLQKLNLDMSDVFLDDRPHGGYASYTTKKALLSPRDGLTHRVILQDDVEVCDTFYEVVKEIIKTHPEKIIALFTVDNHVDRFMDYSVGTPYVQNNYNVSGAGWIIPVDYIDDYLGHCLRFGDNFAEDVALFSWATLNKIVILNTVPSLIQHLGDVSLIAPGMHVRRTKHFCSNPIANWASKEYIKVEGPTV